MANTFHLVHNDAFSLVNSFLFISFLTLMQVEDQRKSVYLVSDAYVVEFCTEISTLCRRVLHRNHVLPGQLFGAILTCMKCLTERLLYYGLSILHNYGIGRWITCNLTPNQTAAQECWAAWGTVTPKQKMKDPQTAVLPLLGLISVLCWWMRWDD